MKKTIVTREKAEQMLSNIIAHLSHDSWVVAEVVKSEYLCPIGHIMDNIENIELSEKSWVFTYDGGKTAEFPIAHTIVRLFGEG